MKRCLMILLIFVSTQTNAQWQWSKQIGGIGDDSPGIRLTSNNVYISGTFVFNCFIDGNTLSSVGYNDWFIAKYDLTGTSLIWYKQIGNTNASTQEEDGGIGLVTSNYLYCIGTFYNTLTIDGISVTSNGGSDAFIAQFDLNGTCIWMKNAGGTGDDKTGLVTSDQAGEIYWSTIINSNIGTIDTYSINKGNVLVKLNSAGTVTSIKNTLIIGGNTIGITIHNNELYFAGVTTNDTTVVDTDTLFAGNVGDALLAKCDLSGNVIWAKRFGNTTYSDDYAKQIAFDASNNLYVTGRYRDNMTIDGNTVSCNGTNNRDMFIAKFNNNGINQWVRGSYSSGTCNAYANDIANDIDGNFYVIGRFAGTAQFGAYNIGTSNNFDMFLARYDQNGDCLGVRHFGNALGYGVETDANGDVLVSGVFDGSVNIGTNSFTSYGQQDGFIAKSDAITGIGGREADPQNQLVIYANPNKGTFTIKVPDAIKTFKDAVLYV